MKIIFNPTTKTQTTDKKDRWIQKASNNFVYLYGVTSSWDVKATFTRRDGEQIGNISGIYDVDPDGTYCHVIQIPTQACELDKTLSVSIIINEPSGGDYIRHSTIKTSGYLYPNDGVIVPSTLEDDIVTAINTAIANLGVNKHEFAAIIGTVAETINKDTEVYSKLKSLEEIQAEVNKIVTGLYTAKKAEQDDEGNVIKNTYETKADAAAAELRIGANESDISTLAADKEDKSNKKTDLSTNSDIHYPTVKAVKTANDLKVSKTQTIMEIDFQDNITRTEVVNAIGEATTILSGLMSATDKARLDALHALLGESADADTVVNTINEVLAIFQNYPEGVDLVTALNGKVDKVEGKQLSTNDLTDLLKNNYDVAYTHSQVTNANPHEVKYSDLMNKPTTLAEVGITDAMTEAEIMAQINSLKAIYGWESSDLTPTALGNTDTLALSAVAGYDQLLFVCRNTATGEIDTQKVPIVELTNGTDIEFFGNSAIVVNVDATNITFSDIGTAETLKIYGFKMEQQEAVNVSTIHTNNTLENADLNVQKDIDELDGKVERNKVDIEKIEQKTNLFNYGSNLFNKDLIIDNYILNSSGNPSPNQDYAITDFINVNAGDTYTFSKPRHICFYDINKTFISRVDNVGNIETTQTIPVNIFYMRLTIWGDFVSTFHYNIGETLLEFEDFKIYSEKLFITNNFTGKTILNLGDSIAYGANNSGVGYADLIAKKYGMEVYDYSHNGATIADYTGTDPTRACVQLKYDLFVSENPTVIPDFIFLEGWANDITLTNLGTYTEGLYNETWVTTEYSGGLENLIDKIKTNFPASKLMYIGVHKMCSRIWATQKQFYDRTIQILNKWSVPIADIFKEGNLNTFVNIMKTNYTDTGTHPNELGYNLFYVPIIENTMKKINN